MTGRKLSDAELLEKLNANPVLRERIGSLLQAVEDETGELKEAEAAELRGIDEMHQMGRESLAAWARGQEDKTAAALGEARGVWREDNKTVLFRHSTFGEIGVEEPQFRAGSQWIRPFVRSRPGSPPELFTPSATGGDGPCCGRAVCPGDGQAGCGGPGFSDSRIS